MCKITLKTLFSVLFCILFFNTSWSQSSDLVVYPTLTFYSSDNPTVGDLVVRQQNIAGTITWYNQQTGGTAYTAGDLLDSNLSYWAELPGTSINQRLQTKVNLASTPTITEGDGLTADGSLTPPEVGGIACENQDYTLIAENIGGIDDFTPPAGFVRLETGLSNGVYHFINTTSSTWVNHSTVINGDPNNPNSSGVPGVSMHMLTDTDLATNQAERQALLDAIDAIGASSGTYWLGMSQFLNSNEYLATPAGTQARAQAGWFWEDGTYYDRNNPINPAGPDWAANEPNDWDGFSFATEEDKIQLRSNGWVDQIGNSAVPARQSGAIIEFIETGDVQWLEESPLNSGNYIVTADMVGQNSSTLTLTSGTVGEVRRFRIQATFEGTTGLSTPYTVTVSASPADFTIDGDQSVCQVGDATALSVTPDPTATPGTTFLWEVLSDPVPTGNVNFSSTNTASTTVTGTTAGNMTIQCTVTNSGGCTIIRTIPFEVGNLSDPIVTTPLNLCASGVDLSNASNLPPTDNNGQDLAWYFASDITPGAPNSSTPEVTGNITTSDVLVAYAVIRQDDDNDPLTPKVPNCWSSNSTANITPNISYFLEENPQVTAANVDDQIDDGTGTMIPNPQNPPGKWYLEPETPGGSIYDLRNLGIHSTLSDKGTNNYYTLFRGVNPETEMPGEPFGKGAELWQSVKVFKDPAYSEQIFGLGTYDKTGNGKNVYVTIQPKDYDCFYEFTVELVDCIIDLGNQITNPSGDTESSLCKVGETVQLDADVSNFGPGYTIQWNANPSNAVSFDDNTADNVVITSLPAGANTQVQISYTATDGSCTGTTASYTINIGPDLTAPDFGASTTLLFCNGSLGGQLPTEDNNNLDVVWFDPTQAGYDPTMPESATPVADTDVLVAQIYHVFSVRRNSTNPSIIDCFSNSKTDVQINLAADLTVITLADLSFCETGVDGSNNPTSEFTLNNATTLNQIFGTPTPNFTDYTLEYYTDASNPSSIIPNTQWASYTSISQTIDVLVYDNRVENSNRCEVYSNTLNLVVKTLPITGMITGPNTGCNGTTVQLQAPALDETQFLINWFTDDSGVTFTDTPGTANQHLCNFLLPVTGDNTANFWYTITEVGTNSDTEEFCSSNNSATHAVTYGEVPQPVVNTNPQYFCNGGMLSDIDVTITAPYIAAYYANENDIVGSELPSGQALVDGTTYWIAASTNTGGAECISIKVPVTVSINLELTNPGTPSNLTSCATDPQDTNGRAIFDLTSNATTILNGASATDYTIEYYDANPVSGGNLISNPANYTNTVVGGETIHTIIYPNAINDGTCSTTGPTFTLTVNPMPIITMPDLNQVICENGSTDITVGQQGSYTYEWYFNGGTSPIPGETTNTITVTQPGTYNVIAETNQGCRTSISEDINVSQSEAPSLAGNYTVGIDSNGNGQVIIDEANLGSGDYEYAIDNGDYQDSPVINRIEPGEHTLIANDKNGCGSDFVTISIFGFPKFFSPNNDGINDTWNVKGLDTSMYNHAEIRVFDRFGKLITRFNTSDTGWDGFYNGVELPATDYWFETEISDVNGNTNKIQGHFSLIR